MSDWAIACGVIAFIVMALILLVWYANRAGKNESAYKAAKKKLSQDNDTIEVIHSMTHAEANKPTSKDAIIARLEKGDA